MNTTDLIAIIGGSAGLVSVLVTVFIAWDSHKTAKKQLDMAAEANATTRLSVEDQVEMNRRANSAALRIANAVLLSKDAPPFSAYRNALQMVSDNNLAGIAVLTLLNEGMAAAYNIDVRPSIFVPRGKEGRTDFSFHKDSDQFASIPIWNILAIPSGHHEELTVAIRNTDHARKAQDTAKLQFQMTYRDGLGIHTKVLNVMFMGVGMIMYSEGTIAEQHELAGSINPREYDDRLKGFFC